MRKNIFLFVLLVFFLFTLTSFSVVFAQGGATGTWDGDIAEPEPLEVEYIPFSRVSVPTSTTTLPNYVKYIYHFAIGVGGIIALGILVIAGLRYLASAGMPEKLRDAKNQISAALLGLLILLCSWLILRTINPQLVSLPEPGEIPAILPDITPGVYLCKNRVDVLGFWEQRKQAETEAGAQKKYLVQKLNETLKAVEQNCGEPLPSGGNIKPALEDEVRFAYLVPAYREHQYGVILYEKRDFDVTGKSAVIYGSGGSGKVTELETPTEWPIPDSLKVSSARPFILVQNPKSSWEVVTYEDVSKNIDDKEGKKKISPCPIEKTVTHCQIIPQIRSVEIEGDVIVIFFKEKPSEWTLKKTEVHIETKPGNNNLYQSIMAYWNREKCVEKKEPELRDDYYPCAEHLLALSAELY